MADNDKDDQLTPYDRFFQGRQARSLTPRQTGEIDKFTYKGLKGVDPDWAKAMEEEAERRLGSEWENYLERQEGGRDVYREGQRVEIFSGGQWQRGTIVETPEANDRGYVVHLDQLAPDWGGNTTDNLSLPAYMSTRRGLWFRMRPELVGKIESPTEQVNVTIDYLSSKNPKLPSGSE